MMEIWESLIVWLHLLLFVYWLGGDLGVFYGARFRNDPQYDQKTRLLLSRIVADIDMAPRTTMVLMIPSGFTLTATKGYLTISDAWLVAIWAFSFAWLALVWWLHIEKDSEKKKSWTKFDFRLRWVLTIALALIAIYSFSENRPIAENFVALKLLIFTATIFCGIMIRVSIQKHSHTAQTELEQQGQAQAAAVKTRPSGALKWVLAIWVLISIAAFIGIWKPYF